jgi:hypothetical protein
MKLNNIDALAREYSMDIQTEEIEPSNLKNECVLAPSVTALCIDMSF